MAFPMFPAAQLRGLSGTRLVRAALAAVLLVAVSSPARSDTETKLAGARLQLRQLETQLAYERDRAELLEEQLAVLHGYIADGQTAYQQLSAQLEQTRGQAEVARERYEELHAQLSVVLRNAYIEGSGSAIGALFDSSSQTELGERLEILSQLTRANALLAAETSAIAEDLSTRTQQTKILLEQQAAVLHNVREQQQEVATQSDQLQAARDRLQSTKAEVLDLVVKYRQQLQLTDLALLIETLQGKNNVTYGAWAGAFLQVMGAPGCRDNLVVMVSWQLAEGTDAEWNPLATTYDMPGATTFNYVGVKNYASLDDGLQATKLTLLRGASSYGYRGIIHGLRNCAAAEKTAAAVAASSWCGCGAGYVTSLIGRVREHYNTYARL